tara:strand:- start:2828 stop:3400 length:573 start_codon:yes stop_codon:yes gene_type:complete
MSGKLIATLFIPYLIISILGTISDDTFGQGASTGEIMVNELYDAQIATGSEAGTAAFTGDTNTVNKLRSGLSMVSDSTGQVFGFTQNLFKVLTLNYSFWSGCLKSTDDDPGYDGAGNILLSGTGSCYIDSNGVQAKDAPMAYMFVRYILLIMGLPAIFVLTFKTAELFSRMVSAIGSSFGALSGFIPGLR